MDPSRKVFSLLLNSCIKIENVTIFDVFLDYFLCCTPLHYIEHFSWKMMLMSVMCQNVVRRGVKLYPKFESRF